MIESDADKIIADNDRYRQNPLLKKAYVDVEWTQELVKEYIKCCEEITHLKERLTVVQETADMWRTLANTHRETIMSLNQRLINYFQQSLF